MWVNTTMDKLSQSGKSLEPFMKFREAVKRSIKELIAIDVEESVKIIDKWYQEEDQEHIILNELQAFPKIQYDYLQKFLKSNENKIESTINEASYSQDKRAEA